MYSRCYGRLKVGGVTGRARKILDHHWWSDLKNIQLHCNLQVVSNVKPCAFDLVFN